MDEIKVNIFNIVGQGNCTLPEDGDKVFEILKKALNENKKVVISFKNVEKITSAFLNNAIGKLYNSFEEEKIKDYLSTEDMSSSAKVLLKRVVSTAKNYFKDPERLKASVKRILGEINE
ncbi:STAS-like domain-containing protein [Aliarcobacter butzleri]|uniref:STAS-like domain-containing protein n=1 Tax=Aliarcobacter butzleri TaxID=28197 RepID=UPI003B2169F3